MYQCSNCEKSVNLAAVEDDGCLVVRQAGRVVVTLCPDCYSTVRMAKIVIKRDDAKKDFAFEMYQPFVK